MLKPYQQRRHLPVAAAQGDPLIGTLGSIAGTAIGGAMGGPAGAAAGGALGSQLGNIASGAPINPTQMAVSGLTAGMTAGGNAAKTATSDMMEAKDALTTAFEKAGGTAAGEAAYNSEAYKAALDKLKSAGSKAMEAEGSMFNDPFGKAGTAIKSVFMSEGGEVKQKPKSKLKRDKDGKLILPLNIDFSKLQPESDYHQQEVANLRQQLESKKKPVKLAMGGKAKGPLCSECEAQYKACGGMTKKY